MFLLPSLVFGFFFATLLGGDLRRVVEIRLARGWTVLAALALQLVIFSRLGANLPESTRDGAHILSYLLLFVFACSNFRSRLLYPILVGLAMNATAIIANGGRMPVAAGAAAAANVAPADTANVSLGAHHLRFLGDVFALPVQLPLANVFSIGDVLIAFGMIGFIVAVATTNGGEPQLNARRLAEPLREPQYRRLLAGRLISQIGDWLTIAALVGWIYATSRSTAQVAVVLLVRLGPPILGSGIAALVVDRLPKRRLLVSVEVARALAIGAAILAITTGPRALVFVAVACAGSLATVSSAALSAVLPSVLPDAQLPSANAGLGIAKDIAMAIGAAGGGLALARIGAVDTLSIDLATFAFAAALYMRLRGIAFESPTTTGPRPSGLRYLLAHHRLLLLVGSFATATLATGLTNATLPRFLGHTIGLGASGYGLGIASIACGMAAGEASAGFTRAGAAAGRWIGGGLLLMGGLLSLLALTRHAPTALFLLAAVGFVDGTTDVLFKTVVQRRADPRHYGCIFGFSSGLMTSTMIGAFAAAPIANELIGSRSVITAGGIILLTAGALAVAAIEKPSLVPRPDPLASSANRARP